MFKNHDIPDYVVWCIYILEDILSHHLVKIWASKVWNQSTNISGKNAKKWLIYISINNCIFESSASSYSYDIASRVWNHEGFFKKSMWIIDFMELYLEIQTIVLAFNWLNQNQSVFALLLVIQLFKRDIFLYFLIKDCKSCQVTKTKWKNISVVKFSLFCNDNVGCLVKTLSFWRYIKRNVKKLIHATWIRFILFRGLQKIKS